MSGLRIESFLVSLENNKNIKDVCIFEKKYLDGYYSTIGSRKNAYSKYRMKIENLRSINFLHFKSFSKKAFSKSLLSISLIIIERSLL